jgi:hypothetical protein
LDGDGFPELILACEWGPIRVFHNDHGRLSESTLPLIGVSSSPNSQTSTLSQLHGWWNGVTTGDLDGDGRLDIIAVNWGENSKYQSHRTAPLRLYYGDFTKDGTDGLIETYFDPGMGKYVPKSGSMSWLEGCLSFAGNSGLTRLSPTPGLKKFWASACLKPSILKLTGWLRPPS